MKRAMLISFMSLLDFSLVGAYSPECRENESISFPDVSYVKANYIPGDNLRLFGFVYKQAQRTHFVKKNKKETLSLKITFSSSSCILTEENQMSRWVVDKRVFYSENTLCRTILFLYKQRIFPSKIPP